MPGMKPVNMETAPERARKLLDEVSRKLGLVPNIALMMANSPAVLEGYLRFNTALASGELGPELRERIAIAVASENGCEYCLSAHTALGAMLGLTPEELNGARSARSGDQRVAAVLRFARKLVRDRGWVTDDDLISVRQEGVEDGEIAEVVAVVALNIFTNYFNHVAGTEIDFPLVRTSPEQSG